MYYCELLHSEKWILGAQMTDSKDASGQSCEMDDENISQAFLKEMQSFLKEAQSFGKETNPFWKGALACSNGTQTVWKGPQSYGKRTQAIIKEGGQIDLDLIPDLNLILIQTWNQSFKY